MFKIQVVKADSSLTRLFSTANLENFTENGKKIIGIAANYKSLLKVLNRGNPDNPPIFLKPSTSYINEGNKIIIPKGFSVNQEIELGVIIGKKGKKIAVRDAMDFVGGYTVALDMTATDQMAKIKAVGGSWTLAKGFDTACPVSKFIPKEKIPNPHNVNIWCTVNGKEVQKGNTNDLFFKIPELVSYLSKYFTLEPNDLIITGSPPGMSPVTKGDAIEGGIKDVVSIKFEVDEEK
ncbi:acylpyruvase FAHD1, mitochondrial [Cylas formicarius]|uniref:acylpyruvase FAHD1, mitochondrial n=1 Tax=Cylas formicarius TaxID=197179 RepID=UPI0029586F83|nr:acylpyruvase FAHD1, mitochondrial [Cylas formicarius]